MNKASYRKLDWKFFMLLGILCLIWVLIIPLPDYLEVQRKIGPINYYEVDNKSANVQLDWVIENFVSNSGVRTVNLFANDNSLFAYGAINSQDFALWQIDQANGDFLKNKTPSRPIIPNSFNELNSISFDNRYIYIAYTGVSNGRSSLIGAGGFAIYDLNAQEIIWSSRVSNVNNSFGNHAEAFLGGNGYVVIENSFREYFVADVSSKTLSNPIDKSSQDLSPALLWYFLFNDELNTEKWEANLKNVKLTPAILSDQVVARTGAGNASGGISILDRDSGEAIFSQKNEVISNVVVRDNFAYYLSRPNHLKRMNLAHGEIETIVEFDGGNFQLADNRGYYVAANSSRLYAYLGDSRQLFAFEFTPPETGE